MAITEQQLALVQQHLQEAETTLVPAINVVSTELKNTRHKPSRQVLFTKLCKLKNELKIYQDVVTTSLAEPIEQTTDDTNYTYRAIAAKPYIKRELTFTAVFSKYGTKHDHLTANATCLQSIRLKDGNIGILEHTWVNSSQLRKLNLATGTIVTFVAKLIYRRKPAASLFDPLLRDVEMRIVNILN